MPRVMSDSELTTGLTKAKPVVIPDRMPMTTLNLDLDGGAERRSCSAFLGGGRFMGTNMSHGGSVTMEREVKTCDAVFLRVSAILVDGPIIKRRAQRQRCHMTNRGRPAGSARQTMLNRGNSICNRASKHTHKLKPHKRSRSCSTVMQL